MKLVIFCEGSNVSNNIFIVEKAQKPHFTDYQQWPSACKTVDGSIFQGLPGKDAVGALSPLNLSSKGLNRRENDFPGSRSLPWKYCPIKADHCANNNLNTIAVFRPSKGQSGGSLIHHI